MDGTVVFIFLLDFLPEDILNKTLETVEVTHVDYSSPNTCDYSITNPLLQVISRELEVLIIPKFVFDERTNDSHANANIVKNNFNVKLKSHLDTNKVLESSLEEDKYYRRKEHSTIKSESLNENGDGKTLNVTKKAPMLTAIFESLSNITAQTCGGTVIAPHWVLTAASCINLLSNLNAKSTNVTEKSIYTVIVNATDPLIDGSAHNVTEIHLYPNDSKIALMKVAPAIDIEEVVYGNVEDSIYVTVHGWSTKKVDIDHDVMLPVSFKALVLLPNDCASHYNITENKSELCMATTDEYGEIVSQLNWGGPIVSRSGGIVAVTRGDGHAPLAGWPLDAHAINWIHATAINGTYVAVHDWDSSVHK